MVGIFRVGRRGAVLRVEERRNRPSLLSKAAADRIAPEIRYDIAPSVPLIARDSFVAETAGKIEQLQATVRLMSRDLGQLASKVAQLQDASEQDQRWQAFQQNEKRSKQSKLDELLRGCRDLKSRLDKIEQSASGDYHAYNSFEAVSRKLAELETFRDESRRLERSMMMRAWVLFAAVSVTSIAVVLANVLVH
jgi:DNA repair exonuclease SbcCD ATPase subunit